MRVIKVLRVSQTVIEVRTMKHRSNDEIEALTLSGGEDNCLSTSTHIAILEHVVQ